MLKKKKRNIIRKTSDCWGRAMVSVKARTKRERLFKIMSCIHNIPIHARYYARGFRSFLLLNRYNLPLTHRGVWTKQLLGLKSSNKYVNPSHTPLHCLFLVSFFWSLSQPKSLRQATDWIPQHTSVRLLTDLPFWSQQWTVHSACSCLNHMNHRNSADYTDGWFKVMGFFALQQ